MSNHTIMPQSMQKRQGSQKRELIIHCLMYGVSAYQEIVEVRSQFNNDKSGLKVKYMSSIVGQIQIFAEFLFDLLNERDEPLVLALELVKAVFRLREYRQLMREEKIKTHIEFPEYKSLKDAQAFEDSLCKLARSQK